MAQKLRYKPFSSGYFMDVILHPEVTHGALSRLNLREAETAQSPVTGAMVTMYEVISGELISGNAGIALFFRIGLALNRRIQAFSDSSGQISRHIGLG